MRHVEDVHEIVRQALEYCTCEVDIMTCEPADENTPEEFRGHVETIKLLDQDVDADQAALVLKWVVAVINQETNQYDC